MVLCSSKDETKRKYTNHWKIVVRITYHVRAIVIRVSNPAASICWERQLKGCNPWMVTSMSLCINSTNCKQISKVNLKPLIVTVSCPWAPAVSSVTLQPAELWLVQGFLIYGTGCHLIVRNCFGVWNADGTPQTSGIIFWMERERRKNYLTSTSTFCDMFDLFSSHFLERKEYFLGFAYPVGKRTVL